MGPKAQTAPNYSDARDAKDLLDMIGQTVHAKVHVESLVRSKNKLQGILSKATYENIPEGKQTPQNPCELQHEYHTTVTSGYDKENPCKDKPEDRFSKERGAECDNSKIKGNKGKRDKSEGACAPFRRLHLCDQHLQHIKPDKITKDNLLAEVCQAAKFEGESLESYRAKYQLKYEGSNYEICTALARSFADIGDIVKGKDFYLGDNKENDRLQKHLKTVFAKIYDNLDREIQAEYNDSNGDFYKLRYDWWEANRKEIWKAITCGAAGGTYFRKTCEAGRERKWTENNCQCKITHDVPTYFDYVPQYLRWFEEWAEDFCRKKKRKVQNLKEQCRGEDGNRRYCSGDGYDCEKTIRGIGTYAINGECTKCSVWCGLYKKWIHKQKEEFEKQKNKFEKQKEKYEKEISGNSRPRRNAHNDKYEGYEGKFYDELKNEYGTVDAFLEKLSTEKECQNIDSNGGRIEFNKSDSSSGTFYHSEYCEECPECGVEEVTFKHKGKVDGECQGQKPYEPTDEDTFNKIDVISFGEQRHEIEGKINQFCVLTEGTNSNLNEPWKCYHGEKAEEVCLLEREKGEKSRKKQKSFNDFFYFWIGRLLRDSIEWRDKVHRCIVKAKSGKCKSKQCNDECNCFRKWIERKKEEWEKIKDHFKTQRGFERNEFLGGAMNYDFVLEHILNLGELFQDITVAYGNSQEIQGIKQTLERKNKQQAAGEGKGKKNTIDLLFEDDLEEADKCKKTQEDCQPREVKNPCATPSGGESGKKEYPVLAQEVAKTIQQKAQTEAKGRGLGSLVGDITKAIFKKVGNPNGLKDACEITKDHSNDSRRGRTDYKGPCEGKAPTRFDIGTEWKTSPKLDITDDHLFLPPRREHFCTSNLEKIHVNNVTNSGNVNHSFLGDVLFAAKSEAEDIKKKFKENNDKNGLKADHATTCRAIRYSFADIGDIIRGKDLWDKDTGEKKTQENLVTIFKEIKTELNGKGKYTNDNSPYKLLRADWWEANRDQVWKAMQCKTNGIFCDKTTPYDDYIPQRLRWMTEWAEWFCKAQTEAYDKLLTQCGSCKGNNNRQCAQGSEQCRKCTTACTAYNTKIQEWEPQWKKIKDKYQRLYGQGRTQVDNVKPSGFDKDDPDYKEVVDFLSKLHQESVKRQATSSRNKRSVKATVFPTTAPNTPYGSAAGYVHQEARTRECLVQNVFCNNNGSPNRYAFKTPPPDYKLACDCQSRNNPNPAGRSENFDEGTQPPAHDNGEEDEEDEEEEDQDQDGHDENEDNNTEDVEETVSQEESTPDKSIDVCNTVKNALENTTNINAACSQKYSTPNRYWGWKCVPTGNGSETTSQDGKANRPRREAPSESGKENVAKVRHTRSVGEKAPGKTSSSSSDKNGAICIPPRRRKLYVGPLKKWAKTQLQKDGTSLEGGANTTGDGKAGSGEAKPGGSDGQNTLQPGAQTASQQPDPLLKAFVESAAVETFFLWDRYKKEWEAQKKGTQEGVLPPQIKPVAAAEGMEEGTLARGFQASQFGHIGPFMGSQPSWTSGRGTQSLSGQSSRETSPVGGAPLDGQLPKFAGGPGQKLPQPTNHPLPQLQQLPSLPGSGTIPTLDSDSSSDPSNLSRGDIPTPFLRQMFYTLGDYRDILVHGGTGDTKDSSGSSNSDRNIVLLASGNREEMENIQKKLKAFFSNSVNNPSLPGSSPHSNSVKTQSNSDKTPSSWWSQHAPSIWKAMICALTYEDKSDDGQKRNDGTHKLTQNKDQYSKLLAKLEKDGDYTYGKVVLKDENSGNGPMPTSGPSTVGTPLSPANGTRLAAFVTRPAYFRWLEEWGETFCRERAKRLEQIYKECKVEENGGGSSRRGGKKTPKCSCYGEDCETNLNKPYNVLPSLECRRCGEECRKYRKWIGRKRTEYEEQESAYGEQQKKCQSESNGAEGIKDDNEFCGKLKDDAAKFLERLKDGPCKNNSEEDQKVNGYINFNDEHKDKTFGHETYCDPCSKFSVNCKENDHCDTTKGENCESKTYIDVNDIQNKTDSKEVDMRISDDSATGFENGLKDCKEADIFKGIRKDEWKCGKVCGYVVCKSKNDNGKEVKVQKADGKHIITIRALVTHWIQYFLEDYNKIKRKLNPCIKKGEGSKCINGCHDKCNCVQKWVQEKRKEWDNIKNRFNEQYKNKDESYPVRSILEDLQDRPEFQKAIKPCDNLDNFEKSKYCAVAANTESGKKIDIVECLLEKLDEKATSCQNNHKPSDKNQTACHTLPQSDVSPPLVGDVDDYEEENEEENKVGKHPSFCDDVLKKTETKDQTEETCDVPEEKKKEKEKEEDSEASGPSKETVEQESESPRRENGETPKKNEDPGDNKNKEEIKKETKVENDKLQPEPKQENPQAKKPEAPPPKEQETPPVPPPLSDQPTNSISDILSSTIPFGIALALTSIAFLFLKKKTKSSVDMLRVLQIPQNDYDIPTLKSKNRYVPYRSAQYRGKRYIYIEGDSGTDSGYTDHYSDITSSSESEYEELDINDIYVPGTPKYKTLIEVVLEPSKRDTQNDIQSGDNIPNSGNTIPNSGDTIPNSDTPNTPSDTPNTPSDTPNTYSDIQNDIPSDNTSTNKPITDEEWNELKDDFISNMLQSEQNTEPNDVPNDYTSGNVPTNTNNTTMSSHNVDNNTHPTPSRHTLDQKPFIMSIHDRNLFSGEEYNYNINMSTNTNNDIPISSKNVLYSGIDLINDALSGANHDIYDELLKRKENELFGTNNVKHTSTHSVSKPTNTDPITNQLELFHKWLDRHRDICEQWDKNNKVDILNQLKEKWDNETHIGNIQPSDNIPSDNITSGKLSDIPSGKLSGTPSDNNIHSDIHPSDIPSGNLSDITSDNNMHSDIHPSDTPSDNNIHSDIHPSDIPNGKISDTPSDNNMHSDIHPSDTPSDNNIHSDIHPSDIPNGKISDTPSDNNIHSDIHPSDIPSSNKMLNTDVSIEIDMHNPKTTNEFAYVDSNPNQVDDNIYLDTYPDKYTVDSNPNLVENINPNLVENINPNLVENPNPNLMENINPVDSNTDNSSMDTILEDLDKPFNEPYFYDMYDDDIYYDVNDEKPSVDDIPMDHNKVDVPKKVHVEMKILNNTFNGSLEHEFPISDLWNI
ncbi:erythrocyte membrane protein 1, PfEMP1, putative [Plasmodium reichenowi]|uniref:Erythrocyte membrane protein 1, PfEMP1, putative n=1 Tax=Plasmodium reichenowi TaxID=5854 RepID=A0A2P9DCD7_PLARE|nr:erythrocyte membrane protein 1, PfEMP1, putative [Plasmodium reichenowi]